MRFPYPIQLLVLTLVGWLRRQQQDVIEYLRVENQILREQLGGAACASPWRSAAAWRAPARWSDAGRSVAWRRDARHARTILRWFRELVARKYDGSARAAPTSRPAARVLLADLVEKLALENPGFGYTRIRDVLKNVGREVARTTVKRILADRGIEPAPERRKRTS